MSSLTDNDDDMRALRAHSVQIEALHSANTSSDLISDESQWFDSPEPPPAIQRDDAAAWKRLQLNKTLHKLHFNLNGKVCCCTRFEALNPQYISHASA
jgi:hypothetical protein